jgi:hypothetical protein
VPKRLWSNLALGAVTLAYPAVVYLSLGRFEPRWLALLLLAIALVRLGLGRTLATWGVVAVALTLAMMSWLGNALMPVKLYPVAVNVFMLVMFASTLIHPPSAIERLARLREPDLPEVAVVYTRKVTFVWCGFLPAQWQHRLGHDPVGYRGAVGPLQRRHFLRLDGCDRRGGVVGAPARSRFGCDGADDREAACVNG